MSTDWGSGIRLPEWADVDRFNDYQRPIVDEIIGHYDDGVDLVCLDAPTGAGKTLIAEVVRQVLRQRAVYICTTKTLQWQVAHDFDHARVIQGRANYTPTDAEEDSLGNLPTCADCDLRDESCSYCFHSPSCPYTVAKSEAVNADLPILNTAYFMGECQSPRSKFAGWPFVIADEMDTLESEIMRHVSISISPGLRRFLNLSPPQYKTKEESWAAWFEYAIPHIEFRMKKISGDSLANKRRRQQLDRLVENMTAIHADMEGWVYDGYQSDRIEFKPKTVSKLGNDILWQHGDRWLAMSATVISPEARMEALGFTGSWAPVFAPSVFPVEHRPIYYCPTTFMTNKNKDRAWPEMKVGLHAVIDQFPNDRILVHTHSYSLTAYLRDNLTTDRPVFAYANSKERDQAIADYDATEGAVLLAPSLDRGFDGIDDRCRVVVLCKVPYPSLGDKQISARLHTTKDGENWYAMKTAESIVQMAGRGMRHENDSCTVIVLDSMFGTFYSKWKSNGGQRSHRLFPNWYTDALHFDSDVRFEIRQRTRQIAAAT